MSTYKLISAKETDGVIRLSDGACIPGDDGNRDWKDYIAWRLAGGEPDPYETASEKAQKEKMAEIGQIQNELISANKELFKIVYALLDEGIKLGAWSKIDFDTDHPGVFDTVVALREKVQRLETLENKGK